METLRDSLTASIRVVAEDDVDALRALGRLVQFGHVPAIFALERMDLCGPRLGLLFTDVCEGRVEDLAGITWALQANPDLVMPDGQLLRRYLDPEVVSSSDSWILQEDP